MRDVVIVSTKGRNDKVLDDILGGRQHQRITLVGDGSEARLQWEGLKLTLPINCRVVGLGKIAAHALMGRPRKVKELLGLPFIVRPSIQGVVTYEVDDYIENSDRRYKTEIQRAIDWAYSTTEFPKIRIEMVDELPRKNNSYVMDLEWTWGQWIGDEGQKITAVGFMPTDGMNVAYILKAPFNKKAIRPDMTIVGHNISGDLAVLMRNAYSVPEAKYLDTICLLKTYNPTPEFTYGLKQWGTYMGFPGYAMTVQEQKNEVSEAELHSYLAKDLFLTREILNWAKCEEEKQPEKTAIVRLESEAILPNATMINTGIPVSEKRLNEYDRELTHRFLLIRARMRKKYRWPDLNLSSHMHVAKLLFDKLGYKQVDGRHAGEAILQTMPGEVPKQILEFRLCRKKKTTYVKPFKAKLRAGRIYADSNLHGAATGRLTRHSPPVQTPPVDMRDQFEAGEGRVIGSSDIDQLEFRLVADVAGEEKLYDAKDVHTTTAQYLYNVIEVTKEQRRYAKTGNFAGLYGAFENKIAATLVCSVEEARRFLSRMESIFPRIAAFKKEVERIVLTTGRISSPFGREWSFEHIEDKWKLKQAVRQAVNRIIQSMGHDCLMIWWILIFKELKKDDWLINEVHDELLFEILEKNVPRIENLCYSTSKKVKDEVKRRFDYDLKVPFTVKFKHGKNWMKE